MAGSNRGILHPARLPSFHRLPAPDIVGDLVRWFWFAEWDLEPGRASRQQTVGFPACNLVVERDLVGFAGPTTHRGDRDLVGRGWAAAALLRPAAVPAFTEDPGSLRDAYRTLALPELHRLVGAAMELDPVGVERPGAPATRPGADPIDAGGQRRARAVEAIAGWLAARIPTLTDEARLANAMADVIDGESEVLRLEDVADRLHVTPRTLQRLAVRYVGVPPAAMIRRRRLQEAAERVRVDPQADLAVIAASLGYTDQSHLTRDFHAVLGFTPGAYRSTTRESR